MNINMEDRYLETPTNITAELYITVKLMPAPPLGPKTLNGPILVAWP